MEWEWKNHDITIWEEEEEEEEEISVSASDVANYSSASTGSSFKDGMKFLYVNRKSGEPSIGLKLGKRTYFENNYSIGKKSKSSYSCQNTRCQVEGCNLDLSSAKEYHRKHRVCENHSKSPTVVVSGLQRRFCQQCSRFHSLAEFDDKKRSCRRRLSDHNARPRKPQQETIHFISTNLSSSSLFYGGRQELSSTWEKDKMKTKKPDPNNNTIGFSTSKATSVEVLDQGGGLKESPNADALSALSLLSNNSYSWGLYDDPFMGPPKHQEFTHFFSL